MYIEKVIKIQLIEVYQASISVEDPLSITTTTSVMVKQSISLNNEI